MAWQEACRATSAPAAPPHRGKANRPATPASLRGAAGANRAVRPGTTTSHTPAKELIVKPRVIAIALVLAGALQLAASVSETRAPAAPDTIAHSQLAAAGPDAPTSTRHSGRLPTAAPDRLMPAFVASTPFAAIDIATLPREVASLPREGSSLPRSEPRQATASPPSPTPTPDRSDCDPAYPDDRTCIPPGPPFDQGCAITDERRFTVLSPDPQRLDHDDDGIGCEPIR